MLSPEPRSSSSYGQEVSLRRRLIAFAITVAINVGLLLMLVFMSPTMLGGRHDDKQLTTFNVQPVGQKDKPEHAKQHEKVAPKVSQSAAKHTVKPVVDTPIIPQSDQPTNMILMTREDFAAADISKLPSHAKAAADAGGPADSETVDGKGPHGETLYAADWYRRPTAAETEPFFGHRNIPDGAWAEVACQTMPRFHVDNCVALQDSPPGLHLARALQQAAWQFLVKPPQVNGKYQVGAWVRIHYEFYTVKADGASGSGR